jgi:hypothetical protein
MDPRRDAPEQPLSNPRRRGVPPSRRQAGSIVDALELNVYFVAHGNAPEACIAARLTPTQKPPPETSIVLAAKGTPLSEPAIRI